MPVDSGKFECCASPPVGTLWVSPVLQENPDAAQVPHSRGFVQGRAAIGIVIVDSGSGLEQAQEQLAVSRVGRCCEWCFAERITRFRTSPLL